MDSDFQPRTETPRNKTWGASLDEYQNTLLLQA